MARTRIPITVIDLDLEGDAVTGASVRVTFATAGGVMMPNGGAAVNVYNTFPTPPADPHTLSRNLAFELKAAL